MRQRRTSNALPKFCSSPFFEPIFPLEFVDMPGLFGFIVYPGRETPEGAASLRRRLDAMASALRRREGERLETAFDPAGRFAVGRIGMAHADGSRWPAGGEELAVYATGRPRLDDGGGLGGFYAALIAGRDQAPTLQADRTGTFPLYYASSGDVLCFAPETVSLLEQPGVRREPDLGALAMFLGSGKLALGRTLFADIRRLCGGERLRLTASGPAVEIYWRYAPGMNGTRCDSPGTFATEFATRLVAAVSRDYGDPAGTTMFLSGGADSRALLVAALASAELPPDRVSTVSWADFAASSRGDVAIARRVAAVLGVQHGVILRDQTDLAGQFRQVNRLLGGAKMAVDHPAELGVMAELARRGTLRVFRGDTPLTDRPLPFSLEQAYRDRGIVPAGDVPALAELLAPQARARILEDNAALMVDFARRYEGLSLAAARDAIFVEVETGDYLFKSNYWRKTYFDELVPLLDDDILDLLQETPDELRQGKKVFFDALAQMWGDRPAIPFANDSGLYSFAEKLRSNAPFRAYVEDQFEDASSGIWRYLDRTRATQALRAALEASPRKTNPAKAALRGASAILGRIDPRLAQGLTLNLKRTSIDRVQVASRILVLKNWHDDQVEGRGAWVPLP